MSSYKGIIGAMLVVSILQSCFCAHLLQTRFGVIDGNTYHPRTRENKCFNYMDRCKTDAQCCDGLECTNLVKGFCYFMETCVCQLPKSTNLDRGWN